MEKRYFRNSFGSLIFQAIIICGLLLDIYASILCTVILSINGINSDTDVLIFAIFVFYLGIPMLIYIELTFLIGNIILNNQSIYTKGDIKYGRDKIQYQALINYTDIVNIEIVPLRLNSKGKYIYLSRPLPYLVLTNKKGKKIRFVLCFMSKKMVNCLLNDLLEKCKENNTIQFDVDKLMKVFSLASIAVK